LLKLSDKYDRDRLNLSTATARNKERDGASNRANTQSQTGNAARRGETKDLSKRKLNEPGDDWRRGKPSQIYEWS